MEHALHYEIPYNGICNKIPVCDLCRRVKHNFGNSFSIVDQILIYEKLKMVAKLSIVSSVVLP